MCVYKNHAFIYLHAASTVIRNINIQRQYISHVTNSQKRYCIRISYKFQMHLQPVILFPQKIGKLFALTAWDLLNWKSQWQHYIKIVKISAVVPEAMLFLRISIIKSQIPLKWTQWIRNANVEQCRFFPICPTEPLGGELQPGRRGGECCKNLKRFKYLYCISSVWDSCDRKYIDSFRLQDDPTITLKNNAQYHIPISTAFYHLDSCSKFPIILSR